MVSFKACSAWRRDCIRGTSQHPAVEGIEKTKLGSSLADSRRMRGKEHQLYQERACLDKELLSHCRDRQEVKQVAH